MTTLIIARHGNTFGPDDTPTRVGASTDLPLVRKGEEQARALGRYLRQHKLHPDAVYCSTLQRTKDTAEIALKEAGIRNPVYALEIFNEIDYGPDENKTEKQVIARIGSGAIEAWDKNAVVPKGWDVDPSQIIDNWKNFAAHITEKKDTLSGEQLDINETVLVVTSNGVARFSPHIAGNYNAFCKTQTIKLSTGALGILRHKEGNWVIDSWNVKPS